VSIARRAALLIAVRRSKIAARLRGGKQKARRHNDSGALLLRETLAHAAACAR